MSFFRKMSLFLLLAASFQSYAIPLCRTLWSLAADEGGGGGPPAAALNLPSNRVELILSHLLQEHHAATTRRGYVELSHFLEACKADPKLLEDYTHFQDAILRVWERIETLAPEFRSLSAFRAELEHELGISQKQADFLVLHYGLLDFGPRPLVAHSGHGLRIHSQAIHDWNTHQHAAVIEYYRTHITKMTVQELAKERARQTGQPFNEQDVRTELLELDISIDQIWARELGFEERNAIENRLRAAGLTLPRSVERSLIEIAQHLHSQGIPTQRIAELLEVGHESLRNILHFRGVENRGVDWTVRELSTLQDHYGVYPVEWIAESLQRTMKSVQAKAAEEGLTESHPRQPPTELVLSQYPGIFRDGKLQRAVLERFLWEQIDGGQTIAQIALALNVTEGTVRLWMRRIGIHPPSVVRASGHHFAQTTRPEYRDRYEAQRVAIAKAIEFYLEHGRVPSASELAERTGWSGDKLFSFHGSTLAAFDSFPGFVLGLHADIRAREARWRDVARTRPLTASENDTLRRLEQFTIFDVTTISSRLSSHPLSHTLLRLHEEDRPRLQARIIARLLKQIEEGGMVPRSMRNIADAVGENVGALFRFSFYREGNQLEHLAIFRGGADFETQYNTARLARLAELESQPGPLAAAWAERLRAAEIRFKRRRSSAGETNDSGG